MWLLINNKALTKDILRKRNKKWPWNGDLPYRKKTKKQIITSLCHVFIQRRYDKKWIGLRNVWKGDIIAEGLNNFCENKIVKNYKSFPLILTWGTQLARNVNLLYDNSNPPLRCASQGICLLNS